MKICPEKLPKSVTLHTKGRVHPDYFILPSIYCLVLFSLENLTVVVQWVESWPANRKVTSSIPVREHAWVVGQVSVGGKREATEQYISHSLNLPDPLNMQILM